MKKYFREYFVEKPLKQMLTQKQAHSPGDLNSGIQCLFQLSRRFHLGWLFEEDFYEGYF